MTWLAIVLAGLGCWGLKASGLSVPPRVLENPLVERVADLIPVALLSALIAVQVFTTEKYPGQTLAVAIEPMTAPADALNSGVGLRRLAPGETWTLEWGITLD